MGISRVWAGILAAAALLLQSAFAASPSLEGSRITATKGRVELSRAGSNVWDPAQTNLTLRIGDGLRVGEKSRATLLLRDDTIVNIAELTRLRVEAAESRSVINLLQGVMSFFHRGQAGDVEVRGGGASAIVRGTEFVVAVGADGAMSLVLAEGAVEVSNAHGKVDATSGETVNVTPASEPRRSTGLAAANLQAIQWTLYYPAVFDPADLAMPDGEILALYRAGDFWTALDKARAAGHPTTDAARALRAALELSVGDVPAMEEALSKITGANERRIAEALRAVVRAAQFEPCELKIEPGLLTTELLARTYCLQSAGNVKSALAAAEAAVARSPGLGIAQARLAELLFANGRRGEASEAVARALELSPKLAPARVTQGFLHAAGARYAEARNAFDHAIALDPAIGDAWLGRGLVRFNRGDRQAGRIDIETAAALEPNRSVLRSYLGKAFAEEGSDPKALAEIERAKALDDEDPTAWLYSALLLFRHYDLSGAIAALEASAARNDNRAIFRSGLLLDQDAAVRSANLANIYEMAGMSDVSRRESARAVMFDYANFSAHMNLASSFNVLRDPTRFDLRNETVWFNEHMLASLLAPAQAAPLSQNLSQNEYSRLFARNRVGFSSATEYFSDRDEVREVASQFGNFQRFSYALDLDSAWADGDRPNSDLSRIEWYTRAKFDLTHQDSVLLLAKYEDFESGDNFQYLDPAMARTGARFREKQDPILLAGYHREWHPGSHTLALGGRLENRQRVTDPEASQYVAFTVPIADPGVAPFGYDYRHDFEIYTAELNHILEFDRHTTIVGGRVQAGEFDASTTLNDAPLGAFAGQFGGVTASSGNGDFERESAYLYHTWEIVSDLRLTGGISYDNIVAPANFRRAPLTPGEDHRNHWSPKAALIYAPAPIFTARAIYAQSLSGVSYDQSVTLEPTQLAGFPQLFRTLISESIVGPVELPRHDVGGLAFDFKLPTRTYITVEGLDLRSDVRRNVGYFEYNATRPAALRGLASTTLETLEYEEQSARISVNQVFAREWFGQAHYQFTRAELDRGLPSIPASPAFDRVASESADLHRASGSLLYQRRDGLFARSTITYLHQEAVTPSGPSSDDLALFDFYIGWRFPRHLGEIAVGLLNAGDSDYRLSPLTAHEEFPRRRSLYLRLRLNF